MHSESLGAKDAQAAGGARTEGPTDPEKWVEHHGDYLFCYAIARVRDEVKAEDLVQETFLAALKGQQTFEGRSAEKSWLVGILRHKIGDHFRKARHESTFTDLDFYAKEEEAQFDGRGAWLENMGPQEWPELGASLDNELFWKAFHSCMQKLPANMAEVFSMRELEEVSTEDICTKLTISPQNLWVILHRARLALRRCLEINWFRKL